MSHADQDAVMVVANAIKSYLVAHPGAADTGTGIQRWWLPKRCADATPTVVMDALAYLTQCGVIDAAPLPDGRVLYSAATPGPDGR